MLRVIFTLDYEIHGNGDGCPRTLMVEPTDRLLRLFEEYGAKLTIMADVAEILKFKEYKEEVGRDDYRYDAIVDQLRSALSRGHDVQLHIHSSYFRAHHNQGRWCQDWSEYNFADLPYDRMVWMVRTGKKFLETFLRPVNQKYRCIAFRAANWCVSPSRNVVKALLANNIIIDTSVFKGGRRQGLVNFEYSDAYHHMRPWPASLDDICRYASDSRLWEFPIYTEQRRIVSFLSINRFYRALLDKFHRMPLIPLPEQDSLPIRKVTKPRLPSFLRKHSWKADFNQCSGRQLIHALLRAERQTSATEIIPFVLIGHPKLFTSWNETALRPFLEFVFKQGMRFGFGTFAYFAQQIDQFNPNPSTTSKAFDVRDRNQYSRAFSG
ncbi:MAG: hypothetical protein JRD93_02465 [Deltaproteobacteria bacterium]|nr:hypothetical protein [Deltaproteobacteria bacterium]